MLSIEEGVGGYKQFRTHTHTHRDENLERMINFGNSQSSGDSNFKLDDLEDVFAFDPKFYFINKTIWNLSRNKKPVLRTQRFRD